MAKKIVRLTESDLHRIVKESVKRVIKEGKFDIGFGDWLAYADYDEMSPEEKEAYWKSLGVRTPEEEMEITKRNQNDDSWWRQKYEEDFEKLLHGYETEPEWYRNHNVEPSNPPGRMAMNAMATDEEDPTGTIRDISRSYNGTRASFIPAAKRFAAKNKGSRK